MRTTVVGTGYVGLVTGACMAYLGHEVTCIDVDNAKIRLLQAGQIPFFEPGLDEFVAEQVACGRLRFVSRYAEAVPGAEVVFICVGTPSLPDGRADTSAVAVAARSLGEHMGPDYTVIVTKSTVPIGTGDWVGMVVRSGKHEKAPLCTGFIGQRTAAAGACISGGAVVAALADPVPDFAVVSNPEFLREGSAISDALHPDRIVIGSESERATGVLQALYAPLLEYNAALGRKVPFVVTDRTSAELMKYAANAFLATKISFINEIANICERVGGDVSQVARGIGLDARVGSAFLSAGIGWGGSCFPKDLASLVHTAREYRYEPRLLQAVQDVNAEQRLLVVRKLQEHLKIVMGKTIALWGLAFKPGTDDVRDAPALTIAERLADLGACVRAYDPQAMEAASRKGIKAMLCRDAYEAAQGADAVLLVTEWEEFAGTNWSRLKEIMRRPLVVDGRNAFDRAVVQRHGLEYIGIGRGCVTTPQNRV